MTNENIQHQQPGDDGAEELGQKELPLAELTKRGATMEEIARLREPVARTSPRGRKSGGAASVNRGGVLYSEPSV